MGTVDPLIVLLSRAGQLKLASVAVDALLGGEGGGGGSGWGG